MPAFTFDPNDYRDAFAAKGWVHIPRGTSDSLLDELRMMLQRSREHDPLRGQALAGEKEQHLFEAADMTAFLDDLFDVVSAMCGLRRDRMTLSERHLKVYDADANPEPHAHKDRFASQISVGLSIEVPEGSRLLLYPEVEREHNRFLTTEHRSSLAPHERPEATLRDVDPVEIADAPGDVVLFYGSSIWHLRRNSAGAALLYLKCNDFDCDPLGEDPTTPIRRAQTLVNAAAADDVLDGLVPVPARRLQSVSIEHGRDWHAETWLTVFDEARVRISPLEAELVRAADGTRTVAELAPGSTGRAAIRRLAELEALDIIHRRYATSDAMASAISSVDTAVGSSRESLRS